MKERMKFLVQDMDIATGGTLIAILNRKDALRLDLHSEDRIILKHHFKKVTCILDISENAVSVGKIGLFAEVLNKLKITSGHYVKLELTSKPESISHIKDKLDGKKLTYVELCHIADDISNDRLSAIEKTYFVAGTYVHGLTLQEIVDFTKAMVVNGQKLKFPGTTLDKHSIGGVPGNRTTMIITPIIAAAGFTMPKTSSRAITSPAGTADTMECLARVNLSEAEIKRVVRKAGACIAHGGAINLAPADDKIIAIEHPLSIDAEGQLVASVMAKKYSVSSDHVLIDIPRGKTTKVNTLVKAKKLQRIFEAVGKKLNMNVKVIISDGSQPIGNGIGPLLEAEDVMKVLTNDPAAPLALREKALTLAGIMLEMTGKYQHGREKAEEMLTGGLAWKKMKQIIKAQGKQTLPLLGRYNFCVKTVKSGKIKEIDNLIIARLAKLAGAPVDKGAGLYLYKHVNELVQKGEPLFTIYAESEFKLNETVELLQENNGYLLN